MLILDGKRYLVEKEISTRYGLSIHWFRRARYEGNSPAYHKLNGKVYYLDDEVNQWFKKNMQDFEGGARERK